LPDSGITSIHENHTAIARAQDHIKSSLVLLLAISMVVRGFLAAWLELGNDEVYYRIYAMFPDWSHFDHPPMLGWMMQLFSLNLLFDSEFFLRFSSVIIFVINTLVIYDAGKILRDELTGLYAALLYNASIYAFVITGIFILPDTPQSLFWLLSVNLMLRIFGQSRPENQQDKLMLLLGLTIGLGMISKYSSVFLWVGLLLFILFCQSNWLRRPALYGALLISALCGIPVIWWNLQHDFISFAYQSGRVSAFVTSFRPDLFITELSGQIFYNNPVNFVLIWLAIIAVRRQKQFLPVKTQRLLLVTALPTILLFLLFSMFRPTLPHWTGPAYTTLILLAAARLRQLQYASERPKIPKMVWLSLSVLGLILIVGSLQIKFGIIPIPDNDPYHRLGKHDVTLDMYGWRNLDKSFQEVRDKQVTAGNMQLTDAIVSDNWFPLANIDYYVARPLGMKALGLGRPEKLHEYTWINERRGGLKTGDSYWYLTTSREYRHPDQLYAGLFSQIIASDTITIMRGGRPAKRVFVFMLKDLQQIPAWE